MDAEELQAKLPDDGQKTVETEYGATPPSIAIVNAIAEMEGVSPTEIDFTLYENVDPDALDRHTPTRSTDSPRRAR